jgi:2-succinyl-5-enolpyruvyl-6-hydroxy-3-cyclohexene-1-carboxylate synthase
MKTNEILSHQLASAVLEQMHASGIEAVVLSPGFRNSPLIVAAHQTKGIECFSAVDERGAAFLALGMAKAGKASALICTSGTALANYLPAVLEAQHSHIPLLVITADRPRELVGTGANQCTEQNNFFGSHARYFNEIPCPEESFDFESHAQFLLEQAIAHSRSPKAGPVHINIRFREPFLANKNSNLDLPSKSTKMRWKILPSAMGPSREQWSAVESVLKSAQMPLILLGPGSLTSSEFDNLQDFSEKTGCPILAEKSAGILPSISHSRVFFEVDPILEAMEAGRISKPDLYIRIGSPLTGKVFSKLLKTHAAPQILFEESGEAREPNLFPSIVLQGGKIGWISALSKTPLQFSTNRWIEEMRVTEKKYRSDLESAVSAENDFTEWHFHHELGKKIHRGNLFLGNSMPIRDFQAAFSIDAGETLSVFSNRGLSGIDGLIASSLGVALGNGAPTQSIIGDLSTLHDLSSFALLNQAKEKVDFTLWVLNNGGGEIFRVVPTANAPGEEAWFTTPQSFDLSALAKGFGISYTRIQTKEDWKEFSAPTGKGVRIIELMISSAGNQRIRKRMKN